MSNNWRRIIFSLISLCSLGCGIYFSFFAGNYAMTGIWLTFCLFTFALGWPEMAESISFLGNNIKLREVKSAINELKQLTAIFSNAILEAVQSSGRWGGFTEGKHQELFNTIHKLLKNFGFTPQEIEQIEAPWHTWNEIDYINAILNRSSAAHPVIPKEKTGEWQKRKKDLGNQILSFKPDDLRRLFQEFGAYTEEVKLLIDDFEYYRTNKQHRDPEKWRQRDHWWKEKPQ